MMMKYNPFLSNANDYRERSEINGIGKLICTNGNELI
jgi:hypothetical protein